MAEDAANPPAEGSEAPAEASAEGGESSPVAPKKKKMLLIISIAVAVIGIAVAVGVVFFMGGGDDTHAEDEAAMKLPPMVVKDIPEFNLSLLSDDPSAQHFIKIKTAVELVKPTDAAAVEALLPKLQDDWGGFLRQMRIGDLQGSANLQRLKEGLLRRANQSLAPVEVKAVYIRELLIQ